MKENTNEVFSEVNSVLTLFGEEYIRKLPPKLYQMIQEKKATNYQPIYDDISKLSEYGLKRETVALLVLLYMNYWCETPEQKQQMQEILKANSEKKQQEMRERYSSQNIFKEINEARERQRIADEELHQVASTIEQEVQQESPEEKGLFKKFFHK